MEKLVEREGEIQTILRRLSNLETHVINLIIPIQGICEALKNPADIKYLIECLKKPIPINDGQLRFLLINFEKAMAKFDKNIEEIKLLELSHTFGEIKYIGKRLNEIEKILFDIKGRGITKNIDLNFTVDGYQMVKKPIEYKEDDPIEEPNKNLDELLNTLTTREAQCIIHRLGLFGQKKKTYDELGKVFGISREPARQLYVRAIRKLRHPVRKKIMEKVTHPKLRKEVYGE